MKNAAYPKSVLILLTLLWSILTVNAQDVLTNTEIVAMTEAGLSKQIILTKINSSAGDYDVSTTALIKLKKIGVADEVVARLLEITQATGKQNLNVTEQIAPKRIVKPNVAKTSAQLLREARTIFFVKKSLYPSLGDLESSLLKRSGWQKFNLIITRDRDEADLIIEINREFLSHYNFRVINAKTNQVLAASGVTSLGGALAGNIADKLIKRLNETLAKKND